MAIEENMPNQEIIDATQDAVLNVVGSVANSIEKNVAVVDAHELEPFYHSAEFWVAISFLLVVFALARPVINIMRKILIKRKNLIAKRIEDAANVHMEAQKMLAEYEKKYRKVKSESGEILARAEREIAMLKKEKIAKLEKDMANKEREAKARIKAAENDAVKEISAKTAVLTIQKVKDVLSQNLDSKKQNELINNSINSLEELK